MTTITKSVSFGFIDIIQFGYCIGDNPCVTTGSVPISIEWDAHTRTTLPLTHFEQIRPPKQTQVRRFSARTRERILQKKGYTQEEIDSAISNTITVKRARASTLHQLQKLGALKSKSSSRQRKVQNSISTVSSITSQKYLQQQPQQHQQQHLHHNHQQQQEQQLEALQQQKQKQKQQETNHRPRLPTLKRIAIASQAA